MSEETDAIRQDIASVRDSMIDTIEQIESKVRGTVDTTVEHVNRMFDLRQQVRERPWVALGAAALVGFAAGSLGGGSRRDDARSRYVADGAYDRAEYPFYEPSYNRYGVSEASTADRRGSANQLMHDLGDRFGTELQLITSAALAAGVNMLRDTIKQSMPNFEQEYDHARRESRLHERAVGDAPSEDRESIQRTTSVDPNIPLRNYEQPGSV